MRKLPILLALGFLSIAAVCAAGFSFRCLGCIGGVELAKFIYERNGTKEEILKLAVFICKHFADHDSFICQGMTSEFQESFLYVLEQLWFRPTQVCGFFVAECGTPAYSPFDANWTVALPPKSPTTHPSTIKQVVQQPSGKSLRVLQLSDLHFDFDYSPGSEAMCAQDLCCHNGTKQRGQKNSTDTVVQQPAGYWGSNAKCDVPYHTIEKMFEHINKTHELDYILLSGDYMSHSDWTYTREGHLRVISNLTALFNTYFPSTPVYWAVGNHEVFLLILPQSRSVLWNFLLFQAPVLLLRSYPLFCPIIGLIQFWPEWVYKAIAKAENGWLTQKALEQTIYRGSYSVMIKERLKLISVNSGYCETTNLFLYLNQTDPDGTMSWLVDELYKAELAGISVHIMSHIPPGDRECLEGWARNYYRVVNRFEETIKAQFFGHVHVDTFTLFYEDMNDYRSRPTGVLFAAPSVTTFVGLNPAYRIYTIDGNHEESKFEVLDFDTHYFNLSAAAASDREEAPVWEKLYSAKEEYGLSSLNAASWHELSERIRSDDAMFGKFLRNYARRDNYPCSAECRSELLCSLRRGHHNDSALCGKGSQHWISANSLRVNAVSKPQLLDDEPANAVNIHATAKKAIWKKLGAWLRER